MAQIKGLTVKIGADISAVKKAFREIQTATQPLADGMKRVGSALTKSVTVPLALAGAAAVKASSDFESAFAGVEKTVDGTAEQMGALRQGIRDLSKEIPQASTEIAGVAEAAGQLGIETDNVLEFTETMVNLGVATNLSSREAATALARFANVSGMAQSDFDRLGATIVDLGNNLATTEAEISEMAQRLAGAGNQIGLSEDQTLAFAAALSSVGVRAEAGGTAFSKLFLDIQAATEKGGDQLRAFASIAGQSSADFAEAFEQDAAGAFTTFIEGIGRIQQEGGSVTAALESIGVESVRTRDAILRTAGAGDLLSSALNRATQAWQQNTALTEEAGRQYSTFASQVTILWNRIKDVAVTIGDVLTPILQDLIQDLEPVFQAVERAASAFAELDPQMQKIIVAGAALAAALGPLLLAVGGIVAALPALGAGVLALTGPFGLAAAAVAGLTAVGIKLLANWDDIERNSPGVANALKRVWRGARIANEWAKDLNPNNIGLTVAKSVAAGIRSGAQEVGDAMAETMAIAYSYAREARQGLGFEFDFLRASGGRTEVEGPEDPRVSGTGGESTPSAPQVEPMGVDIPRIREQMAETFTLPGTNEEPFAQITGELDAVLQDMERFTESLGRVQEVGEIMGTAVASSISSISQAVGDLTYDALESALKGFKDFGDVIGSLDDIARRVFASIAAQLAQLAAMKAFLSLLNFIPGAGGIASFASAALGTTAFNVQPSAPPSGVGNVGVGQQSTAQVVEFRLENDAIYGAVQLAQRNQKRRGRE